MFGDLAVFVNRLEELNQRTFNPAVAVGAKGCAELMKEYRNLEPIVEKYREYLRAVQMVENFTEILGESGLEREMKEMIQQELNDTRDQMGRTAEEPKILLLPRDPNDEHSVIIEIRSGADGEETALPLARLFRIHSVYATRRDWKTELLDVNETELGRYREVSSQITGDGVYSRLKYESGVHRIQCVPETETQGRIHTFTAAAVTLPKVNDVEIETNPTDLQIGTYRASDAGGQHVSKTESIVRITHLPTGMVVECQDERNQFKNEDRAMRVLRPCLYEAKQREQDAQVAQQRKPQVDMGDCSERTHTYNFPQGWLIDHRIDLTIYRLEKMLSGDLNEVIDTLITADHTKQLEETIDHQK